VHLDACNENADKTEVIWFGSQANLAKLKATGLPLSIGSESIQPVSVVRDLGVLLDAEQSMKQHINKVTATCCYHFTATATNSTSRWSRTDHTTGTGTCLVPARLLQFSIVGFAAVHS